MVNSVLSSSLVYHISILKMHKGAIKQVDKYKRHCLWRGADLNSKQPSKAAWPLVCLPKKEGGLGVTHNDALLLKFLHKFFTKAPIPWVRLVWEKYYSSGKLPDQQRRGSFWWRGVVNLGPLYKGLASPTVLMGHRSSYGVTHGMGRRWIEGSRNCHLLPSILTLPSKR